MNFPAPLLLRWERLKASPLGYRLAKGAFWSMLGTFFARALALLASIVTARVLGAGGFADLCYIQLTTGLFGSFAGFGIGMTATKYVAEYRQLDPAKAGQIMALCSLFSGLTGLLTGVSLFLFAPWVATIIPSAQNLSGLLRIGSVGLVMGAISSAQTGALTGLEAFKTIARINLWAGLTAFPLAVAGVLLWGLPGAVWGLVGALAVNVALNYLMLRQAAIAVQIPVTYRGCLRHRRILWRYSLPAVLASLTVTPVNWLCNVLLGKQAGGDLQVAIFGAADRWRSSILLVPNAVATIVLPILANLAGQKDERRRNKVLFYNIVFVGGFTLAAALGLSLFAPFIMTGYGKDFVPGQGVLVLLLFSAVLNATISVIGQSIASAGKMWWGMILNFIWGVALVGSAWFLIRWGAVGLAWANLIAYGLHLVTVSAYTYWFIIKKSYVVESRGA
jgi:O-antigen/teichoic acid export membrane protein